MIEQSPTPKKITPVKEAPPLILASSITERELQWLWYPYLPGNSASLIFGRGGMGKSHITVEIAAALTTGRPLPGETFKRPPQKVLMLSAEDEFDTVLVPRLRRAGANLDYVAFPKTPFTLDLMGLRMMEEYIRQFSATIIFIDPIVHYMGGKVDMFRSNEVREIMGGIHQLAIKTQTTIIVVGHSRKNSEGDDVDSAMGSVDFINAVRSVLYVTKTNDGTRVMRHAKANYSELGLSIPFTFDSSHFEFGEPFTEDGTPGNSRESDITVWLRNLLKDGPVPSKEVEEAAEDEGFSMRTVARHKDEIAESFAERVGGKIKWFWRLKEPKGGKNGAKVPSVAGAERIGGPDQGEAPVGGVETLAGGRAGGSDGPLGAGGPARGPRGTPAGDPRPDLDDPKAVAQAFLATLTAGGRA